MKQRKAEVRNKKNRQGIKNNKNMRDKFGNKLISPEIILHFDRNENDFYSAVIEFYGIDTTGPSYEGRVFFNNPNADESTPLKETSGYVGSFHIFGHDGCWGDEGHCEPPLRGLYDARLHTSLAPAYKYVDATKAIKKLIRSRLEPKCTVTVVPRIAWDQRMSDIKDVVHIERIRINCYENALKAS